MCIRFFTIRRISQKECVCQQLQKKFEIFLHLRVNSVQVAHEGASFVDTRRALESKVGGGFDVHPAVTEWV